MPRSRSQAQQLWVLGLPAAMGAPALLLMCGCWGLVEPSRRPSDGSQPSTDHSRYEVEPQDQVAGGRWLLHVGGSRGLLPGLESATAKISGSGRSGVPPDMSTWRIPSGVARGAAQPEHGMARPAVQHHPTHGARARSAEDAERRTLAPTQKSSATPGSGGSGGHSGLSRAPGGGRDAWEALPPQASAPQPWSYCARSGGRAPHNSRQVG